MVPENRRIGGSHSGKVKVKSKTALPGQIQMKKIKQFEEEMKMANKRMFLTVLVVLVIMPLANVKLGEKMTEWAMEETK